MQTSTELTTIARLHADQCGVAAILDGLEPGAWMQVGDLVEVGAASGQNAFIVRRRRVVVAADGSQVLVLQLDHPPRR